jgi:hypothetical protein
MFCCKSAALSFKLNPLVDKVLKQHCILEIPINQQPNTIASTIQQDWK